MIEIQDSILDKGTETNNNQAKEKDDQMKLMEKLQQTQTKLYESKNNCSSLKQELNKLHKVFYVCN